MSNFEGLVESHRRIPAIAAGRLALVEQKEALKKVEKEAKEISVRKTVITVHQALISHGKPTDRRVLRADSIDKYHELLDNHSSATALIPGGRIVRRKRAAALRETATVRAWAVPAGLVPDAKTSAPGNVDRYIMLGEDGIVYSSRSRDRSEREIALQAKHDKLDKEKYAAERAALQEEIDAEVCATVFVGEAYNPYLEKKDIPEGETNEYGSFDELLQGMAKLVAYHGIPVEEIAE